jgi:hypothetical protein
LRVEGGKVQDYPIKVITMTEKNAVNTVFPLLLTSQILKSNCMKKEVCNVCKKQYCGGIECICPCHTPPTEIKEWNCCERCFREGEVVVGCGCPCHKTETKWEPEVLKWIEQGRDAEHIYAVKNFLTGQGAVMIKRIRKEAFEEGVRSVQCVHDFELMPNSTSAMKRCKKCNIYFT